MSEEAKRALRFKDAIIGINNRNLKTLITDLNTTYEINSILLNHAEPIISESGINTKDDIIEIQNKTNKHRLCAAFLHIQQNSPIIVITYFLGSIQNGSARFLYLLSIKPTYHRDCLPPLVATRRLFFNNCAPTHICWYL